MKKKNKISIITIYYLLFLSLQVMGQINLVYPIERSVFQRDNQNNGRITISGTTTIETDSIQARLVPVVQSEGSETTWKTIDNSLSGKSFTGYLNGKGGWYNLHLQAFYDGNIVSQYTVQRVGIGEVFIICGQSNAAGIPLNNPNIGAYDDRVSCHTTHYGSYPTQFNQNLREDLGIHEIGHVDGHSHIGPFGTSPWCYGILGDKLASKFNVPILFFNAAVPGSSSSNWVETINGQQTISLETGTYFQHLLPYSSLRKVIANITDFYGFRGILWCQGEFDYGLSENQITSNLTQIINTTRAATNHDISWMVARTSKYKNGDVLKVINAQNQVINSMKNVFAGPYTDLLQPVRPDGVHFGGVDGMLTLASAWEEHINQDFLNRSNPKLPSPLTEITHACHSNSSVSINSNLGYKNYYWSDGSNNLGISKNNGAYNVIVQDQLNKYIRSNTIDASNVYPTVSPNVINTTPNRVCIGNAVTYSVKDKRKYASLFWSNGSSEESITVNNNAAYYASFSTEQGCLSPKSNLVTPEFVLPPSKPVATFSGNDGYVCKGSEIRVQVNNPNNFQVKWSSGETNDNIVLKENLNTPLYVTLYSNFDCPSEKSDIVQYKIVANPPTPTITQYGPFAVTALPDTSISQYKWFYNNTVLMTTSASDIEVSQNGQYSVQLSNNFTKPSGDILSCISPISRLFPYERNLSWYGIAAYPNPVMNSVFYLASAKEIPELDIQLFDTAGKLIYTTKIHKLKLPQAIRLEHSFVGKGFINLSYNGLSRNFFLWFS